MLKIYVNYKTGPEIIPPDQIELLVSEIFRVAELTCRGELGITMVGDEEMAALNEQYRNMKGTTDILSFPQDEGYEMPAPEDEGYLPLLGDIIISVPRAIQQAEEYGHSPEKEFKILLIHGILHIFGYDHKNVYQENFMREEENSILSRLEENEQAN
ncbi:MAG: rRNA maturation RNase YbeY [Vulcanimicrobiota bacterium]